MLSLFLLFAADPPEVPLTPGVPGATLTAYLPAKDKATGTAIIICPGGGYGSVVMSYEGREVAQWLADRGIAGYVLRYRLGPKNPHPIPLQDAQRAIRTVRAGAKANNIDPQRVGIWGFSAGGHLASSATTIFDHGDAKSEDPIARVSSRPDFAILAYPVIAMEGPASHAGSRRNLLGEKPDAKLVASLSTHTRVTKETPPTFLFHTKPDKVVPIANSEMFRDACLKAGVPVKLRVAEQGGHGVGLGLKGKADYNGWPEEMLTWLKERELLKPRKE